MTSAMIAAAMLLVTPVAAETASAAQDHSTLSHHDQSITDLGEITVEGRPTREAAEAFVRSVSAPVRTRKAATWRRSVCVGVGGLKAETAQFITDRISDWAYTVGLAPGEPGCKPQIVIIATDDGDATARQMVAAAPRNFRTGASSSDQGSAALRAFQSSGSPIRWWPVSLPINANTDRPLRRLPGQGPFSLPDGAQRPSDLGDFGNTVAGSRLTNETRDDLLMVTVILDMKAFDQANLVQAADYIAMVSLAQIDPSTAPAYPSILSLFADGNTQQNSMSRWDRAYLNALYSTPQRHASASANASAIAMALTDAIGRADAGDEAAID